MLQFNEFLKSYGLVIISWLVIISYLGTPENSFIVSIFQTLIILIWSYYGHRIIHENTSKDNWLYKYNPHIFVHHDNIYNLPRWLNVLLETIVNFVGMMSIYFIPKLFGFNIINFWLALAGALLYISIHITEYSVFMPSPEHKLHHKYHQCNYEPYFMDVLFNTRCELSNKRFSKEYLYPPMNYQIIHALFVFIIVFSLKNFLPN